jgi:hypothetical protein
MTLREWLGRLVGRGPAEGGPAEEGEAVVYRDFTIIPKPIRQGGQFLTAGTIAKDFSDGRREHRFVRADTHSSEEEAKKLMVQKAQRLIDEVGDGLFKS